MLSLLAKSGVIDLDSVDSDELEAILDSDSSIDEILDEVKVEPKDKATTCSSLPPPAKREDAENPDMSEFVRRTVRPRRSSNRFGDNMETEDAAKFEKFRQISPVGKRPKLSADNPQFSTNEQPKTGGIRTLKPRIPSVDVKKSDSPSTSQEPLEFSSTSNEYDDLVRHCLEPDLLLAYALRYGPPNPIPPNTFGVRLAVGPDEYATVEAVEYLRSLGYPNIEMDESTFHSDQMALMCDELNKRILSIRATDDNMPLAAIKSPPKSKSEKGLHTLIRNSIEEANESEFSRSRSSSNSDVEVEIIESLSLSDSPVQTPAHSPTSMPALYKKKIPSKPQDTSKWSDSDRTRHNCAERQRRIELRDNFNELSQIIASSDLGSFCMAYNERRVAKVAILKGSIQCIQILNNMEKRLIFVLEQLVLKKDQLTKHLKTLEDVIRQRSSNAETSEKNNPQGKSKQNKKKL